MSAEEETSALAMRKPNSITLTTITTTATTTITLEDEMEMNMKRNEEILECQSQLQSVKTRLTELQQERKHLIALQQVRLSPQTAWSSLTHAQRTSKEFVVAALRVAEPEEMGLPHALQWAQLSPLVRKYKHVVTTATSNNNNNNNNTSATTSNTHPNNSSNNNNNKSKHHHHHHHHRHGNTANNIENTTNNSLSCTTWPAMLVLDRDVVLARIARCDFLKFWKNDPFPIPPTLAKDVQVMSALMQQDVMSIQYASVELRSSPILWKVMVQQFQQRFVPPTNITTAIAGLSSSSNKSYYQRHEHHHHHDNEDGVDDDDDVRAFSWNIPFHAPVVSSAAAAFPYDTDAVLSPPSSPTHARHHHHHYNNTCPLACLKYFAPSFFDHRLCMLQLVQATAHWGDEWNHEEDRHFNNNNNQLEAQRYYGYGGNYYGEDFTSSLYYYRYAYNTMQAPPSLPTASLQQSQQQRGGSGGGGNRTKKPASRPPAPCVLSYLGSELRQDKAFMLQVLHILTEPMAITESSASSTTTKVSAAQRRPYPTFLQWCMPLLQNDANFVMKVLRQAGGFNLKYASPALRRDYNLCRAALESCPWAICFCTLPKQQPPHHRRGGGGGYQYPNLPPNWLLQEEFLSDVHFWQNQVLGRIIQSQRLAQQQQSSALSSFGSKQRLVPPWNLRHETAATLWQRVPHSLQQNRTLLLLALEAGILNWNQIPPHVYQVAPERVDPPISVQAAIAAASAAAAAGRPKQEEEESVGVIVDRTKEKDKAKIIHAVETKRTTLAQHHKGSSKRRHGDESEEDDNDESSEDDSDDNEEEEEEDVDDDEQQPQQDRQQQTQYQYGRWATARLGLSLYDDDDDEEEDDHNGTGDDNDEDSSSPSSKANSSSRMIMTATDSKFCRSFLQQALERNPTVYLSWSEEQQADPDLAWTAIRSCCQKLKEHQEQQQQQDTATQSATNSDSNDTNQSGNQPAWSRSTSTNNRSMSEGVSDTTPLGAESSLLLPLAASSSWLGSSYPMTDALEDVVAEASVHVPDVVWQDWQVVQYLVQSFVGEDLFQWLPLDMRQDKELMLLACQADGHLLEYCDEVLWNDPDVVQAALRQNPLAADHLPEVIQLRHVPIIVQAVIDCSEDDVDELSHVIEEEVWLQRDVILAWIRRGRDVRDVWDDFDVLLANPRLSWIPTDELLWLTMAEYNEIEFGELAPEELRQNVDFMTKCVERNGNVLGYALVDDLLDHVDTLVTSAFATSIHSIQQFIDPANFEFMVKASRRIRDGVEFHQGFVYVLGGIQYMPQPFEEDLSGSDNERPAQCYLPLLNRGFETSLILKQAIADYAGVPTGKQLRLLRQASTNLAAWGF